MKQLSIVLLIVLCLSFANGLIHHLHIREDTRGSFFIENFGFLPSGTLHLNLTNFQVDVGSQNPANHRFGIVIKHSLTDYHRFLQDQAESECLLDNRFNTNDPNDQVILLTNWQETIKSLSIPNNGAGYYSIYFISCEETEIPISFDLELIMYNPGPDYLSAGQTPLPTVYVLYSVAYFVAILGWVWFFMLPREGHIVLLIHYLMTVTVLLKFGSVFFHSVELHYLKAVGHPGGWTWVYLVFSFLKGITFFVVIALIGTGWAFVKPYLNERDKNVILIVIPLQVISNIALIVLEETSPGSQSYFTFYDIFRLVDIVCCVAVLVPVIGSIRHLQEAAQVDGKAAKNVEKLKLFREFYMLVVSYVYFTRIIVFLLESTLYYNWVWLSTFVSELCTLGFFIATGYYFRPVEDNPYLKIDKDFAPATETDSDSV